MDNRPLTWPEIQIAALVCSHRRIRAMRENQRPRYGAPSSELWGLDVEAAAAEMTAARDVNRYWSGAAGPYLPDVGYEYEVRHTAHEGGGLILHEEDPDRPTILVVGRAPNLRTVGWFPAEAGKTAAYWDPTLERPAFYVRQTALFPVQDLAA